MERAREGTGEETANEGAIGHMHKGHYTTLIIQEHLHMAQRPFHILRQQRGGGKETALIVFFDTKKEKNSFQVKHHIIPHCPRIITKSKDSVPTVPHIHLPVKLTTSKCLGSPGEKIFRSCCIRDNIRMIRTEEEMSQIFTQGDMTGGYFIFKRGGALQEEGNNHVNIQC